MMTLDQLPRMPVDVARTLNPKGFGNTVLLSRKTRYAMRQRRFPLLSSTSLGSTRAYSGPYPSGVISFGNGTGASVGRAYLEYGPPCDYVCCWGEKAGVSVNLAELSRLANQQYQFGLELNQYRYIQIMLKGKVKDLTLILPKGEQEWIIAGYSIWEQEGDDGWAGHALNFIDHEHANVYRIDSPSSTIGVGQELFDLAGALRSEPNFSMPVTVKSIAVFEVGEPIRRYTGGHPSSLSTQQIDGHLVESVHSGKRPETVHPFSELVTRLAELYWEIQAKQQAAMEEAERQEREEELQGIDERIKRAEQSARYSKALWQALSTTGRMSDIPRFMEDPDWYDRERNKRNRS